MWRFTAKSGSSTTSNNPPWSWAWTAGTPLMLPDSWPVAESSSRRPGRSVTSMRPSGRKASPQGLDSPVVSSLTETSTVAVAGAAAAGGSAGAAAAGGSAGATAAGGSAGTTAAGGLAEAAEAGGAAGDPSPLPPPPQPASASTAAKPAARSRAAKDRLCMRKATMAKLITCPMVRGGSASNCNAGSRLLPRCCAIAGGAAPSPAAAWTSAWESRPTPSSHRRPHRSRPALRAAPSCTSFRMSCGRDRSRTS